MDRPPGDVIPLGNDPLPEPPRAVRPPRRLHGLAMVGMVVSAIVGFLALLGFVTVRWPGDSGRIVMAIFLFSIVGFVVCGSASIFTAARDTYATYTPEESPGEE